MTPPSPRRLGRTAGMMILLLLLGGVRAFAAPPSITAADLGLEPFIAPLRSDTLLHGIAGAMAALLVSSVAAALTSQATIDRYPLFLPALGASASVLAGISKETLDSTGFGDPQWSDLVHTVVGGLAAAGFMTAVEHSGGGLASKGTEAQLYAGIGLGFSVPIAAGLLQEVQLYLVKRRLRK